MVRISLVVAYVAIMLVIMASFVNSFQARDIESPRDRVSEEQIRVYSDRIVIKIDGASWTRYANTNSMDPFLDEGANGIEIVPENEDEIYVGDVVAYESKYADGLTVHRVIDVREDEAGRYFVLKGDNLSQEDPENVRFSQIKYVLIGVVY
ncbi:MAG: hypothetical protein ABIB47_00600 [Candidatus Woesearchaeota archaeon]